ncbi:MAG: glycosyltransferase family 2 protein [Clostridium sp.]
MSRIGCVIVTYNPGVNFKNVLEEVEKQVEYIIIVDNGSKNDMSKYRKEKIEVMELGENKGIAYALNRGIEKLIALRVDWILTLDHDSIVTENMLEEMLSEYKKLNKSTQDRIAMIVPKHVEENSMLNDNNETNEYEFVLTEITSGALVKREIYEKERLYEEKLFIDLVDHEFCLYLNRKNFKILRVNKAILKHNLGESKTYKILGKSITPTNHSPIRRYYMSRNRRYVWEKYKDEFNEWIKIDKKRAISENIKIILFEKNKIEKLRMTLKGKEDYKKGVLRDDL